MYLWAFNGLNNLYSLMNLVVQKKKLWEDNFLPILWSPVVFYLFEKGDRRYLDYRSLCMVLTSCTV